MLLHQEGDSIQLLLLLARMGKGRHTEYHKGLYGEGKTLDLQNLTFNHGCSSMCVSSASHPANWNIVSWSTNPSFLLLTWTLPQLADVCINASFMKCQLGSVFVKYTSRALYLTDCELTSVECEIPFLKLLLSLVFFLSTVSVPGLLLHTPQAWGLFYASVMFQLVFHLKSKALHLYCKNVIPRWQL